MLSTVAPELSEVNCTRPRAAFHGAFTAHAGVSFYRVSPDKTSPSKRVNAAELADYEFFTPPQSVGSALVIDVDHAEAVLSTYETFPAEIHPSWVVETRRGAQAGWLIDPVDLRPTAREHPIRYARAVGEALRQAVNGDEAVDPLTPARVRNPTYERAELRASATPPVYQLRALHQALKTANLWNPSPTQLGSSRSAAAAVATTTRGAITKGSRNLSVFDATRYVAYAGGDYEAAAWDAADRCTPALPAAEVHTIIRSVSRYITGRGRGHRSNSPMPSQMRDLLSEMGRRGGKANTPAQYKARSKAARAATAARQKATDTKALQAQKLRARGHTRTHICQQLQASAATVCRWLRRFIRISLPEHQVVRIPSRDSRPFVSPLHCTYPNAFPRPFGCSATDPDPPPDPQR